MTTISRIHRIPTSFGAAAALLLAGAAGAAEAEIEAGRMVPAAVGKPVLVCRPTSDLDRAPFLLCWRTTETAGAVVPQGDSARRSLRGRPATDAADLLDD